MDSTKHVGLASSLLYIINWHHLIYSYPKIIQSIQFGSNALSLLAFLAKILPEKKKRTFEWFVHSEMNGGQARAIPESNISCLNLSLIGAFDLSLSLIGWSFIIIKRRETIWCPWDHQWMGPIDPNLSFQIPIQHISR